MHKKPKTKIPNLMTFNYLHFGFSSPVLIRAYFGEIDAEKLLNSLKNASTFKIGSVFTPLYCAI